MHEDSLGGKAPSFPPEGAAQAGKGTPCNVHSPLKPPRKCTFPAKRGIPHRRLPVRTSWLMPSMEMTASGMPFPWESVTRPLMPRCTCSANMTRRGELTDTPYPPTPPPWHSEHDDPQASRATRRPHAATPARELPGAVWAWSVRVSDYRACDVELVRQRALCRLSESPIGVKSFRRLNVLGFEGVIKRNPLARAVWLSG